MIREWVICFEDGQGGRWWDIFTSKGYRHILAFGFDAAADRWVVVDPNRHYLGINLYPPDSPEVDWYYGMALDNWNCVSFRAKAERGYAPFCFGCVGAIKALLGVRCWAQRPRAFYRWLLANGGERVDREIDGRQESGSETGPSASGTAAT